MAELEERPSKIRKLDSPVESNEPPQGGLTAQEASDIPSSEATATIVQPGYVGEEPFQDGKGESEDKFKLSKSKLKKLRKAEQWEAGKEYRRFKRREKHKEKQARKAEERAGMQAKIASGEPVIILPKHDEQKPKRPRRPTQIPVSLILDCDFNELMTEKELISLGAQLTRCYSENKKTPYRSHLAISSWGGTLKSRFETVLTNNQLGWKGVRFYEEDFMVAAEKLDGVMRSESGGKLAGAFAKDTNVVEVESSLRPSAPASEGFERSKEPDPAAKAVTPEVLVLSQNGNESSPTKSSSTVFPPVDSSPALSENPAEGNRNAGPANTDIAETAPKATPSIIYLTSDSPHTLEFLSPNTSYIIGGIVDKNRHKGICYKRACERGIPTAKLPIGEYMTMQSRSVLAINHVVEIVLKWLVTGDWGEAFLSVIPKRKEAKLKVKKGEERQEEEGQNEDEEGGASIIEHRTGEAEEAEEADEGEESDGIR